MMTTSERKPIRCNTRPTQEDNMDEGEERRGRMYEWESEVYLSWPQPPGDLFYICGWEENTGEMMPLPCFFTQYGLIGII